MKTSNDQGARVLAAVLQQQLAKVGIALELRSFEFATFYSDVTRGAFQIYSLRWVGGNEQPDIFGYNFLASNFSPKGANRAHYSNARLDILLTDANENADLAERRRDYVEAQQILANDLSGIQSLVCEYNRCSQPATDQCSPSSSGDYGFLKTAELAN